jgi:Holliday junction resolvasome RuvABC endonuclease subunit
LITVLGLDCASTTGWAVVQVRGGKPAVSTYGKIKAGWAEIRDLINHFSSASLTLAVLETPYVDKNPDTTIKLARLCGRFEQELDAHDIAIEVVKAWDWQRGLLRGLVHERSTRPERKAACRRWVRAELGLDVGEDEADAIAMAVWMGKRQHFEALTRRH